LDYVLRAAALRNIKLILPLVNNWCDFGGMDRYIDWCHLEQHDQFFFEDTARHVYKQWVFHLLNRRNTLTGIRYKEDPTIAAWELANEPRCDRATSWGRSPCEVLLDWVHEMSSWIKQHDSEHLVAVGDEGFLNRPRTKEWLYNGSQGGDFGAFLASPFIDFGTFHLFPDSWLKNAAWGEKWIKQHVSIGREIGKPVLLEEYGLKDQLARSSVYPKWMDVLSDGGGAGDLFWMLAARQDDGTLYPDFDGFTVYQK
jgi:mannan endo-1,4-beta-mannosidase